MNEHFLKSKAIFILLILGGLFYFYFLLNSSVEQLINLHFNDAFYYYTITENILAGNGVAVTPGIPTNGFHPLYLVITLPVFWLFEPFGPNAPIIVVQSIFGLFYILTGYYLYKIVKNVTGIELGGLFAAGLWVLNPYVMTFYRSGMEIPIQILLISILVFYSYNWDPKSESSIRGPVIIGILLGFIVLARMDGAFIAIGIALSWVYRSKFVESLVSYRLPDIESIYDIVVIIVTSLIIASPWFIFSYVKFNRFLPMSSEAIHISRSYDTLGLTLFNGGTAYFSSVVGTIVSINHSVVGGFIFGIIAVLIPVIYIVIYNRRFVTEISYKFGFLLIAALLHFVYYVFYQPLLRSYYMLFISFVTVIFISVVYAKISEEINIQAIFHVLLAVVLLVNLSVGGVALTNGESVGENGRTDWNLDIKYQVAQYINNNIDESCTIGVWGGEVYHYYITDHMTVEFDGVVNPETLAIYESNGQWITDSYIDEYSVDYIIVNKQSGINSTRNSLSQHDLQEIKSWGNESQWFYPALLQVENEDC